MAERIGLEAFVDTSKFKPGFAEYVSGMDKMIFGTERLSDTMEGTVAPSTNLANKITDLGNRIIAQQKQLDIYNRELDKMINLDKATAIQIDRKRAQIDHLSVSIDKNTRTLGIYRQQVEASQRNLQHFEQEAKETQQSLSALDVTIGSFAGTTLSGLFQSAVSAGAGLLVDLTKEAYGAVASHEKLTLAIETLTARELINTGQAESMAEAMQGASGRSQDLLKWIEELAVKSPFTSEDIAATFKLAQAYGFTSAEAQRLTQVLTDFTAGAGLSAQVGEHIALALGQISAKGKVSAQELNQLREAGLNVNNVLEGMGFNLNDVEKGMVKADAFIAAIVQTLERDFEGAAERQTESWAGLLSTLEDTKRIALREFFQGTFDAIQPLAADFVATLSSEEFKQSLRESGAEFAELVKLGAELTKDIDWGVIARGFKLAAEAAIALGAETAKLAQTGSQVALFYEGVDAAVAELDAQGETTLAGFVRLGAALGQYERTQELIYSNDRAAQAFNNTLLGVSATSESAALATAKGAELTKEAYNSAIDAVAALKGATLESGNASLGETFGVSNELTSADIERRQASLEKLGDVTEAYTEKVADFNKDVIKASQDYASKERELQSDLAVAWQEQYAARQEAATELSSGLIEAEEKYNQAVAEIGQERLQLDEELNASRLEADQEFNAERAKLESDFNQAVAEIGRQRIEAEATLNQEREEAQAEALAAIAELEREHAEEIGDIQRTLGREVEDFNRERLRSEEEFDRERGELEAEHAQTVKDLMLDIEGASDASAEKRFGIEKDLKDRLDDLEDKRKNKVGDIQEEINEILSRRTTRGLGSEKSLSKRDQERLADLREQLAEETAEFDKQRADLEEKAKGALEAEVRRNSERVDDLQNKLAEENAAYDAAIAEQDRKFAEQAEDRRLAHDRAVEDLTLRLNRENAEYDRQRADIQNKLNERLGDLQASYEAAIAALDTRFAAERIKFDEQKAALQGKYQEELADLQKKHDEAVGKLAERFAKETAEYNKQRAVLQATYRQELVDIEASYAERVAAVREKLEDIAVANAEKQLELRAQMRETKEDFEEKLAEIGDAWGEKGALGETQKYVEYLAGVQAYLASTKFPVNFELKIPDIITPGSPSPLEESLMRTEGLIQKLNSTPLSIPTLSTPMMNSPVQMPPMVRGGDTVFSPSLDLVLPPSPLSSPQDARNIAREGAGQIEGLLANALMEGARRQKGNYRSDFGVRT